MAGDGTRADELPAGEFSAWVGELQAAIRGERDADVPCDGCTACCTSAQFVHIAPDEIDTLAHVPRQLLFPAPRLPAGHVVLGYDEQGRCPMLVDGSCSIYDHRPRTCRTYDCRVFAAAGVDVGADGKNDIARRARRWQFSYAAEEDRVRHDGGTARPRRSSVRGRESSRRSTGRRTRRGSPCSRSRCTTRSSRATTL